MAQASILIVEDEPVVALHLASELNALGYKVNPIAENGALAIEYARAYRPDLILMDIVLDSGMNGIETAGIIRNELNIPVIFLTGNADLKILQETRKTEPYGYITKPLTTFGIVSTIDAALHRRELERKLSESEARYRTLFESAGEGILAADLETKRFVVANPAICAMLGYSPDEITRLSVMDIHPSEALPDVLDELKAQALGEKVIARNIPCRRSDGSVIYCNITTRPMLLDGRMCNVGFFTDNTKEQQSAEVLRKREERYRLIIEQIEMLVYDWDVVSGTIDWSGAIEEITGYSHDEFQKVDIQAWEAMIHPEDRAEAVRLLNEASARVGKYTVEYRFKKKDGTYVHIEDNGVFLPDARGISYRMIGVMKDITKRKQYEEEIRENEQRYHALFDQSPVGIFRFDINAIVTDCNDRLVQIMRSTRERIIGLNLFNLREERVKPMLYRTLEGETTFYEGPYQTTTSDHSIYMQMVVSPLRDAEGKVIGGMGIIEDITERRIAEEMLRISEERNRILIENAVEGISVIQNERFVFANPSLCNLTGLGTNELFSRYAVDFIHEEDRGLFMEHYRARMHGGDDAGTSEVRILHRNGSFRWIEINSVSLQWEGGPALLMFMRDVTERKAAEEERRAMEAQIQQTQKLESLGVLAGGIAHDFNNLLTAILGNIDLAMLDLPADSSARSNLVDAAKASHRASDLCRQMLAYSGRAHFESRPLNLNEIIEEMTHILEVSISKKVVLRRSFGRDIPLVYGDPTQIRQVIMNLVINASEAIGDTSGTISITTEVMECDSVYLASTWIDEGLSPGTYVVLEIADTGSGMDEATLSKIFDPFFTTKFTGRGLGLAAVLGIVRGHKGAIKVTSTVGEGSTFRILLPAMKEVIEDIQPDSNLTAGWHSQGTVLLVDDEESVRSLGKKMLERLGFSIILASNGREAVDLVTRHAETITLVILDLTMPEMDGEETFHELKRIRDDIRVVISSGYSEQVIKERFAGKGIAGFIQKPYRLEDLEARLKQIFV